MSDELTRHLDRILAPILGHVLSPWPAAVTRAVTRIAARRGVPPAELIARLRPGSDDEALAEIVAAATVPHTGFFRHPEHFDYLARRVLPRAARRKRHLSIWSAGCASGEEAYTLAMVARDAGVSCRILATDVSDARVAQARLGRYPARAARRIPGHGGGEYVVPDELKRMVRFEAASLTGPEPSRGRGPFDLIFCRNVLIYFSPEDGLGVIRTLLSRLRPEGALVVAPTEAVVRAPWQRPEPDAPVGWFVPDRGRERRDERAPGRPRAAPVARTVAPTKAAPSPVRRRREPDAAGLDAAARAMSDGNPAAAERALRALLDTDPEHAEGWFLLGEALFARGERTQARAAFLRAARATHVDTVDAQTLRDAATRRAEACN